MVEAGSEEVGRSSGIEGVFILDPPHHVYTKNTKQAYNAILTLVVDDGPTLK